MFVFSLLSLSFFLPFFSFFLSFFLSISLYSSMICSVSVRFYFIDSVRLSLPPLLDICPIVYTVVSSNLTLVHLHSGSYHYLLVLFCPYFLCVIFSFPLYTVALYSMLCVCSCVQIVSSIHPSFV